MSAIDGDAAEHTTSAGADDSSSSLRRRVAVRKEIPEALRQPPLRRVVLLRRAPPDAPLIAESDNPAEWWRPGPRLDSRGKVVAHSLLGRPEEFFRMGLLRGHLRPEDVPPAYRPDNWEEIAAATAISEREDCARNRVADTAHNGRYSPAEDGIQEYGCTSQLTFGGPALSTTEEAADFDSGRVSQINRLTEQVNQCGMSCSLKQHPTASCAANWDVRRSSSIATTISSSNIIQVHQQQQRQQQQQQQQQLESSAWRRSSLLSTPPRSPQQPALRSPSSVSAAEAAGRSVKLAGPRYSFIGGWNYQRELLLGRDANRF